MLQTLVENAVKHGIARIPEGGVVRISILPEEQGSCNGYRLAVENSSPENVSLSRPEKTGTGLLNTLSRLNLLYGPRHGFSLEETGTEARATFWFTGEKCA